MKIEKSNDDYGFGDAVSLEMSEKKCENSIFGQWFYSNIKSVWQIEVIFWS